MTLPAGKHFCKVAQLEDTTEHKFVRVTALDTEIFVFRRKLAATEF